MDPITQGALGASATTMIFGRSLGRWALPVGCLAGMAADLDVFISMLVELELPWTYHRHFTHSLAFIPFGGLLVALPFLLSKTLRAKKSALFGGSILAYATHGLLDGCTSYGTLLLWPFADRPIAWDSLPIVEPFLTLAMLACLAIGWKKRQILPAWIAALLMGLWTCFGFYQRDRALALQAELAQQRGQTIEHGRVFPMPLSMFLWRSLYRDRGSLHADALRLLPFCSAQLLRGGSTPVREPSSLVSSREKGSRRAALLRQYQDFCDGFVARVPDRPEILGDMRFVAGFAFEALWGIRPGAAGTKPEDPDGFQWLQPLHSVGPKDLWKLSLVIVRGDGFEPFPRGAKKK